MAIPGNFPLQYTGVNATNPPQFVIYDRAPTIYDYQNFALGTIWEYQIEVPGNPPTYNTSTIWQLVAKAQSIGTWVELTGSTTSRFLTGNTGGPIAPTAGNINIVGAGNIAVSGNPATSTLTITRSGSGGSFIASIKKQYFTSSGVQTYTASDGLVQAYVECIGGGGGTSGLCSTSTSSVLALIGGAGGGGYCAKMFTATEIGASQTLTVGAAGTGGAAPDSGSCSGSATFPQNPGTAGGDTSFGAGPFMIAYGGGNNTLVSVPMSSPDQPAGPGVGGLASGGDINIVGQNGAWFLGAFGVAISGNGGNSGLYGNGGFGVTTDGDYDNTTSNDGTGYGGGGSGVMGNNTSSASYSGASGSGGAVIITEYLS